MLFAAGDRLGPGPYTGSCADAPGAPDGTRRTAIRTRLFHHSDRGVQYASRDYTELLREHGIQISISRKASPWDNAACKLFTKTWKYEGAYRAECRDLAEAWAGIGVFLEKVYNQKRLHSAFGYLPPAEFERGLLV